MLLPYYCHGIEKLLPGYCHVVAVPLPCFRRALTWLFSCYGNGMARGGGEAKGVLQLERRSVKEAGPLLLDIRWEASQPRYQCLRLCSAARS